MPDIEKMLMDEHAKTEPKLLSAALSNIQPGSPPSIEEIAARYVAEAIAAQDAEGPFDHVELFAQLPIGKFVKLRRQLKEALGRELPSNDFNKAVDEARQRRKETTKRQERESAEAARKSRPATGASITLPCDIVATGAEQEPNLLKQAFTDTGNAERLVLMYGRDIHYCIETKSWLVWDGWRWNCQDARRIKALAKRTIRKMYAQAADADEPKFAEAAEIWARKSESAKLISAMLQCAEYEDGIPVSAAELDQHPFVLNCLNGTLDLKQNCFREHRRDDLITKLVHVNYNSRAECPVFLRFLYRIMGDSPTASEQDAERAGRLVAYLEKCFGHTITADVSEKAVFCLFDAAQQKSGNNGKTTLLEIIRFVLAEYSCQVLIEALMTHQGRESSANLADLADLRGARFVTTSEVEEGHHLAVGKLKYLTQGAGSEIKSCRKYENPVTFPATHKLFLDANHKPVIRGTEKAVFNRLKPIPFSVTIGPEEMDKTLLDKLKGEAEGILAWLVEGCKRWLKEGLGQPPEIDEASAEWQAESDRFPSFLEEKLILDAKGWVTVALLWPAYCAWIEVNKERSQLSKSQFDARIESLGCHQGKRENGTVRAWMGIRFRTKDDDRRDNGT